MNMFIKNWLKKYMLIDGLAIFVFKAVIKLEKDAKIPLLVCHSPV